MNAECRREWDRLEDVRVDIIARLAVAQAAKDDPALDECWPLHRSTWEDRVHEVKRLESELVDVNDDMLSLLTWGREEVTSEPMDVHESPYTTGYYGAVEYN